MNKGDLIAEVHEVNTVTAEIAIPEKEIGDVKVGQKLVLKARAYPQSNFEGTVVSIAPVANTPEDPRAVAEVVPDTEAFAVDLLVARLEGTDVHMFVS